MHTLLGTGLDIFGILDHKIVRRPGVWVKKKLKTVRICTYVKRLMINVKYDRKILIIIVTIIIILIIVITKTVTSGSHSWSCRPAGSIILLCV